MRVLKKLLLWLLIGLVTLTVAIGLFVGYIAMSSGYVSVKRSIVLKAMPSEIFPHIVTPTKFDAWNPLFRIDRETTATYSGPPVGLGAKSLWLSPEWGTLNSTITQVQVDKLVLFEIVFLRPYEMTFASEISLKPKSATETEVTWGIWGQLDFGARVDTLSVDIDRTFGQELKKGLINLQKIIEKGTP
jgi:hypothetical protein